MSDKTRYESTIRILTMQRDAANNAVVQMGAEIDVLNEKIRELEAAAKPADPATTEGPSA